LSALANQRRRAIAQANAVQIVALMALLSVIAFLITSDVIVIVLGQSTVTAAAKLALLIPLILVVILYFGRSLRGISALPEIPILVTLALASALWSYQMFNTIERAIPLCVTTAVAISAASILSLRNLIVLFAVIGAISMIGSLMAIATVPGARGIPPWENTWNGAFNHKNGLGGGSVLALIFTMSAAAITTGNARRFFGLCAGLSLFLLVASESRSAQIVALFSLAAVGAYYVMKKFALIWAVVYFLVVFIFMSVIASLLSTGIMSPLFEALDRKPTISGRLPLWSLMGPYIMEEFWLGYGYRAFWDPDSTRVVQIARDLGLGFAPHYSHNGIIETFLHVGMLGVLVLTAALLRVGHACYVIMQSKADRTAVAAVILVMMAFVMMNIVEGTILSRTSLSWMSFVAFGTKACLIAQIARKPATRFRADGEAPASPRFSPATEA